MLEYNIKMFHYEDGTQVRIYKRPVTLDYSKADLKTLENLEIDLNYEYIGPFGPVKKEIKKRCQT